MEDIARRVAECKRCELWRTRTNVVVGEGSLRPKVVFIGEAPGRNEDLQGRPFVGAAGQLLTELLEGIGLTRGEVYIANVLKCRPPDNRDPLPGEVEACTPFLDEQLEVLRPSVISTLGRFSTAYVFSKAGMSFTSMSKVRGRVFQVELLGFRASLLPTYHPAAALYYPRLKQALAEDFRKLASLLAPPREARPVDLSRFM
ncbi:MAG: type-4 uracil-DNA glycosylase [Candidatus Nezhaarchaeota archaeon]|nr:type-4 uracil-DNA glycosylase [Candidatus Nezhaarchaeota archaeon]